MDRRLQLQTLLEGVLGTPNVYFQPPSSLQMIYPCIVYQRDNAVSEFADNNPYSYTDRYQLTVIDRNPDSDIPAKVGMLPQCLKNRFFIADNLNHDVFTIYF